MSLREKILALVEEEARNSGEDLSGALCRNGLVDSKFSHWLNGDVDPALAQHFPCDSCGGDLKKAWGDRDWKTMPVCNDCRNLPRGEHCTTCHGAGQALREVQKADSVSPPTLPAGYIDHCGYEECCGVIWIAAFCKDCTSLGGRCEYHEEEWKMTKEKIRSPRRA